MSLKSKYQMMSQKPEKYSSSYNFPANGILLLDSGVGSILIASEIKKLLPTAPLLSLGDQKFFPYGMKTEDFLLSRVHQLLDSVFENFSPSVIVIACNTASTCVLDSLRQKFEVPIVGVVPPIKPAAEYSANRKIGLLCTEATLNRPYLDRLILDFASDCSVTKVGCKALAELAEKRMAGEFVSLQEVKVDLHAYMNKLRIVDSLVLGCTHFSIFRNELEEILGCHIKIFDPAIAVARQVARVFEQSGFQLNSPYWYMTTDKDLSISKEKCISLGIEEVYSL